MSDRTEAEIRNAALEAAEKACKALPYENFALTEAIYAIRALKSAPTAEAIAYANSLPEVRCPKCEMKVLSKCSSDCPVPDAYAAQAPAKGADVVLPPCPKALVYRDMMPCFMWPEMQDYARAAVLADRQQRGGDASEWIALKAIAEYPTPGEGSMSAANMREIARKALSAIPSPPPPPPSIPYRKVESGVVKPSRGAPVAAQKADDARDAERYRWLRANFRFAADSDCEIWFDSSLKHSPADQLDSAIDAALAQQRKGE